jgi:hypothetical protein
LKQYYLKRLKDNQVLCSSNSKLNNRWAEHDAALKEKELQLKEFDAQLKAQKQELDKIVKLTKLQQSEDKQKLQVQQTMIDTANHDKDIQKELIINQQQIDADIEMAHISAQRKLTNND